jgi:hypothetical protein
MSFDSDIDINIEKQLSKAADLSEIMRSHQEAVKRVGAQRREVIRDLRRMAVPYRVIASACKVTDQALFADLRKHPLV